MTTNVSGHQRAGDAYNDTHRAFLQALLARQSITFESARPVIASIQEAFNPGRPALREDVSRADFENYIYTLNAVISAFDLEIRSTVHQVTTERTYALVNTTSDVFTQIATTRSADEIAYVRRLLDGIFDINNTQETEVMAITSIQALQLAKPSPESLSAIRADHGTSSGAAAGLTMAQAQHVLSQLTDGGWLELSAAGFYSLTPRALMELRQWLTDTYNDEPLQLEHDLEDNLVKVKTCLACKDIITVGQRCSDVNCMARVHNHCRRNVFRAQQNQEICPLCRRPWSEAKPVGEKAALRIGRTPSSDEDDSMSDSE